jgi:hypothetical protein
VVVPIYNPKYMGGIGKRILGSGHLWAKVRTYLKNKLKQEVLGT